MQKYRKLLDEPSMSDKTLLVNVEDLINMCFGTSEQNVCNFKMVQTVLHIIARQMRLLEQDVEIKFDELGVGQEGTLGAPRTPGAPGQRGGQRAQDGSQAEEYGEEMTPTSSTTSKDGPEGGEDRGGGRADRGGRRGGGKGKPGDKATSKDRDDRGGSKDRDKGGSKARKGGGKGSPQGRTGDKDSPEGRGGKGGAEGRGGKGGADAKEADKGGAKGRKGGKRRGDREGDDGGGQDDYYDEDGGQDEKGGGGQGGGRDGDRGGAGGKGARAGRGADRGRKGTPESGRSGAASQGRSVGREGSRTSITVSEAERKGGKGAKDKILVGGRVARVGSIEVVTASQFALLEKAVRQLQTMAGPLPMPALPDNEKLRKDLAKGTASLPETMQAMQLNARVQAAEHCLTRMASLLTQLAAAGALPQEMANRIGEVRAELREAVQAVSDAVGAAHGTYGAGPGEAGARHAGARHAGAGAELGGGGASADHAGAAGHPSSATFGPGSGRKSVAIDATSTITSVSSRPDSMKRGEATSGATSRGSTTGRASLLTGVPAVNAAAGPGGPVGVTHPEMEDVLQNMKDDLLKDISAMTAKATHASEVASNTSKSVEGKLEVALKLDKRITKLFSQTADYSEQLSGFDSGLTTQMASFQEQMAQMRNDLKGGLGQLEQANNNAETAAIVELTERYEGLVIELDTTLHTHQSLTILQKQLSDELRSLVECVEMLREQKADRDEVFDGLRDKADISRLAGLLHEEQFAVVRDDLERRLELCYDKFKKQDRVWLGAVKDLSTIAEGKAEIMHLLSIKDLATEELKKIQETLRKLFILLGEPKAAILTRLLAKGAVCAACLAPALMEPVELAAGQPYTLPALRPPPLGEEAPCLKPPHPRDARSHVCHRWVGGSHTLMADNVTREKAIASQPQSSPTKKYTGYGTDGKLYMLEEELMPCLECNKMSTDEPEPSNPSPTPTGGGGDQAPGGATPVQPGGDAKGNK